MSTPLDYTQTPELLLLELINVDNGTALLPSMVTLSLPVPVSNGVRNTKVTLTATADSPYSNTQDVFYNRIQLSALGPLSFTAETPYDVVSLLATINGQKNAFLWPTDLEDFVISPPLAFGEYRSFNLTAKDTSIRWIGAAPIEICYGLPSNMSEFDHLINVTLPAPGYLA